MDSKSPEAFRTISEVAEWLGVPTHVLRFWESRFGQIKPVKRAGGRRYYRPTDMELLGGIRKLLHEDGMTIRGVQKLLREKGVRYVADMSPPLNGTQEPPLDGTQDMDMSGDLIEAEAVEVEVEVHSKPAEPREPEAADAGAGPVGPEAAEAAMAVDVEPEPHEAEVLAFTPRAPRPAEPDAAPEPAGAGDAGSEVSEPERPDEDGDLSLTNVFAEPAPESGEPAAGPDSPHTAADAAPQPVPPAPEPPPATAPTARPEAAHPDPSALVMPALPDDPADDAVVALNPALAAALRRHRAQTGAPGLNPVRLQAYADRLEALSGRFGHAPDSQRAV